MRNESALLMLHGFTGSGASWAPVIAALGSGHRTLTPDIRGHGAASAIRPVTVAAVLDDLERELTAAGSSTGESFTLVGYSQGGRIALHVALDPRFSGRLARLVLIGASPGLADAQDRAARRAADERLAAEFETLTIEQLAERWATTPILGGITPEQAAQAHADRLRSTPTGLAAALRGLGTGALPSLWERLPEIALPTTLVTGERDPKFTAIAAQMAKRMPNAETVAVAGAGHAVQLEQPRAVARLLVPLQ